MDQEEKSDRSSIRAKARFLQLPNNTVSSKQKKSSEGATPTIKFNPPIEDGFTPLTKSQKRKERVLSERLGSRTLLERYCATSAAGNILG